MEAGVKYGHMFHPTNMAWQVPPALGAVAAMTPAFPPMGLNLVTYIIQDGHGFGIPQETWAVKQGKYDLILLMETNNPDAV